jgi:hypothetical protein
MNKLNRVVSLLVIIGIGSGTLDVPSASAQSPPSPAMTNGGASENNGMKHVNVSLTDTVLGIHVDSPPVALVIMTSGLQANFEPAKFDVLEGVYFNAQHGWLPTGFFAPLPQDASLWIRRIGATQPAGSSFKVYEAGNMMEGMASWTMNEIYAADGATWRWDGLMQHDYFTADLPGEYSMSFEVYVGDGTGSPLAEYSAASTTLQFLAVPEPTGGWLFLAGVALVYRVRRR